MQSFFGVNIKILKIAGLWIPFNEKNRAKKIAILIFDSVCVFYSIIFFTIAEIIALKESSKNINDLVKNLNMSLSFLLTFCKVVIWLYNREDIIKIMKTMDDTWNKFEAINDFNPESTVKSEKKIKDVLTYTFFILAFMVPTSACVLTFFKMSRGNYNEAEMTNNITVKAHLKLPYHSYVPFDYNASQFAYGFAVIYQCLALLSCGTITVGFDMLYTSLVSFTSAHLEILQGAFKNIKSTCIRRLKRNGQYLYEINNEMDKEMVKCIQHLQLVVGICESLESIFSFLLMVQVFVSLVVFCTCLYLLSSIPMGSNIFGNELLYMMAIENQLALYCYSGNKLTLKGEGIPFALYEIEWYEASSKFKKNLIFTMTRMNKPIHLTAGKFIALNLATFVTIGRGSYSLLAVLKNS